MSDDATAHNDATAESTPPVSVSIATPAAPTTTKVRIDTPGASVEIEAHADLDVVAGTALRLFQQAGGWPRENTRAAGFATAERRDTPAAQPSSMEWAPGGYPVQYP